MTRPTDAHLRKQVEVILDRITLGFDMKFRRKWVDYGLELTLMLPLKTDATTGAPRDGDLGTTIYLPYEMLRNVDLVPGFISYVRQACHLAVTHEVDEWFAFEGRRLFDPHNDPRFDGLEKET